MRKYTVCEFENLSHTTGKEKEVDWETFVNDILGPHRQIDSKRDARYIIAGKSEDGSRARSKIKSRSMLSLDTKQMTVEQSEKVKAFFNGLGVNYALHSTWSHTTESPRFRMFIPLSRDVNHMEYVTIVDEICAKLAEGVGFWDIIDKSAYVFNLGMFAPAYEYSNTDYDAVRIQETDSDDLDVEEVLKVCASQTEEAKTNCFPAKDKGDIN